MKAMSKARIPATTQETPDRIRPWKKLYKPSAKRAREQPSIMILRSLKPFIGLPSCLKMAKKKIAIIIQVMPMEKRPVMALYIPMISRKATPA